MVLFSEASIDQAMVIMSCLEVFCKASGERVNNHKSSIFFSGNTPIDVKQAIVDKMGIPKVQDLGKYLGIPSIHGRLKKETFRGILEKMRSRLTGWKSKTLSLSLEGKL